MEDRHTSSVHGFAFRTKLPVRPLPSFQPCVVSHYPCIIKRNLQCERQSSLSLSSCVHWWPNVDASDRVLGILRYVEKNIHFFLLSFLAFFKQESEKRVISVTYFETCLCIYLIFLSIRVEPKTAKYSLIILLLSFLVTMGNDGVHYDIFLFIFLCSFSYVFHMSSPLFLWHLPSFSVTSPPSLSPPLLLCHLPSCCGISI